MYNLLSVVHYWFAAKLYTALYFQTAFGRPVSHDYSLETSFAGNGRSWTYEIPHGDVKVSVTLFVLHMFH